MAHNLLTANHKDKSKGLWISDLKQVMFRFHDKNLFEQNIAHSLNEALQYGCTNGYSIDSEHSKPINDLMMQYKIKEYKQTPILDKLDQLA